MEKIIQRIARRVSIVFWAIQQKGSKVDDGVAAAQGPGRHHTKGDIDRAVLHLTTPQKTGHALQTLRSRSQSNGAETDISGQ